MKSIHDADALLTYKVGPVYCCSPTISVEAVMMPPSLNHPPGTSSGTPGVFRYVSGMVKVIDLRQRFGLSEDRWQQPGKVIVVEVESGRTGFWVDEILDVTEFPQQGWKPAGALIPKQIFSRTLLVGNKIYLYGDFEKLAHFQESGYLRDHIQQLLHEEDKPGLIDKSTVSHENKKLDIKVKSDAHIGESKSHPVIDKTEVFERSVSTTHKKIQETDKVKDVQNSISHPEVTVASRSDMFRQSEPIPRNRKTTISDKSSIAHKIAQNKPATVVPVANKIETETEPVSVARQKSDPVSGLLNNNDLSPVGDNQQYIQAEKNGHGVEWFAGILLFTAVMLAVYFVLLPVDNRLEVIKENQYNSDDGDFISKIEMTDDYAISYTDSHKIDQDEGLEGIGVTDMDDSPGLEDSKSEYRAIIEKDSKGVTIILSKDDNIRPDNTKGNESKIADISGDMKPDVLIEEHSLLERKSLLLEKANNDSGAGKMIEVQSSDIEKITENKHEMENQEMSRQKLKESRVIIHIVVKGDTLWDIAKKYVNNPFKYSELARLSKIENPDLIYPGDRVRIIKLFNEPVSNL